jgi:hypothetical protein
MIARNCSKENLLEALRLINETEALNNKWGPSGNFQGNIVFKRLDPDGRGFHFTLGVKSSHAPGGRINAMTGRHIAAACWHAHGRFFDALFSIAPAARVYSSFFRRSDSQRFEEWITKDTPWKDGQIGSAMYPVMYSESCEC